MLKITKKIENAMFIQNMSSFMKVLCVVFMLGCFSYLKSMDIYRMKSVSMEEKLTREKFDNGAIAYRLQKNELVTFIKRKKLNDGEYHFKGYISPVAAIEKDRDLLSKEEKVKKWEEFNKIYETLNSGIFKSLKKSK